MTQQCVRPLVVGSDDDLWKCIQLMLRDRASVCSPNMNNSQQAAGWTNCSSVECSSVASTGVCVRVRVSSFIHLLGFIIKKSDLFKCIICTSVCLSHIITCLFFLFFSFNK